MKSSLNRILIGLGTVMVLLVAASVTLALTFPAQPNDFPAKPFQQTAGTVYIKSHRVSVTIENQIAVTKIEQVFVNETNRPAEGTYLFPLPEGAAVSNLVMYINGQPIQAKILDAQEAQKIYTETVRRLRDPALLQYVGRSAIQANVFPIPPGDTRKIEITYSNPVTADNGLIAYTYPLKLDYVSKLPVLQLSISVDVTSQDPVSTIYSPNPLVGVSRIDDKHFRAGFETSNYRATDDFTLYYGVVNNEISANLLTYRGSANEDGFFMLMLNPPTKVDSSKIIPKDVIIVLDQSGSMFGQKWQQAQGAVGYVLKRLNPSDRFNAIVFSTGYRIYAKTLQPVSEADKAIQWVNGLEAEGGTDINAALMAATAMMDKERQTIVLFLTDGLPTEGVTDAKQILENFKVAASPNLRLFAFGVGDDVDPFLLDSLSSTYGGTSVYVRPNENIEVKVSALYNKITSPVLTSVKLDFGTMAVDDMYPFAPLPDLFAGTQLVVVGRFRDSGTATITLTGLLNGSTQTFTYTGLNFSANAGGQPFIPRLWATRKIGYLLNQIRLNGEKPELVDAVVKLSVRYGIITPYTSYLIQESDIPGQTAGNDQQPAPVNAPVKSPPSADGGGGAGAVQPQPTQSSAEQAGQSNGYAGSDTAAAAPTAVATATAATGGGAPGTDKDNTQPVGTGNSSEPVKQVNDRTFVLRGGVWIDTLYTDKMKVVTVIFLSDDYFKLLADHPEIKDYLAIGDHVLIVIGDTAYEIKPQ